MNLTLGLRTGVDVPNFCCPRGELRVLNCQARIGASLPRSTTSADVRRDNVGAGGWQMGSPSYLELEIRNPIAGSYGVEMRALDSAAR